MPSWRANLPAPILSREFTQDVMDQFLQRHGRQSCPHRRQGLQQHVDFILFGSASVFCFSAKGSSSLQGCCSTNTVKHMGIWRISPRNYTLGWHRLDRKSTSLPQWHTTSNNDCARKSAMSCKPLSHKTLASCAVRPSAAQRFICTLHRQKLCRCILLLFRCCCRPPVGVPPCRLPPVCAAHSGGVGAWLDAEDGAGATARCHASSLQTRWLPCRFLGKWHGHAASQQRFWAQPRATTTPRQR